MNQNDELWVQAFLQALPGVTATMSSAAAPSWVAERARAIADASLVVINKHLKIPPMEEPKPVPPPVLLTNC
jgi:hypothetical protein